MAEHYSLNTEEIYKELGVTPNDLSGEEAKKRLARVYHETVEKPCFCAGFYRNHLYALTPPILGLLLCKSLISSASINLFSLLETFSRLYIAL